MIFTIWGNGRYPNTLVAGDGPPRFVDGSLHGDCPDLIATLDVDSWEEAVRQYDVLLVQRADEI